MSATVVNRIARFFGYVPASQSETERADTRSSFFAVNRALYDGTIYSTRAHGGYAENVLEQFVGQAYCDPKKFPIYPFFLPFKEIVDTYLNVFPGSWGGLIRPADDFQGKPINPKIQEPLWSVWDASGLDTAKQRLTRWSANYGTCGLRVWAEEKSGDKPALSFIGVDEPWHLFDFEEDGRRNTTAVVLKYNKLVNFGTLVEPDWQSVEIVEEINKDEFSYKQDDVQQIDDEKRKNRLGFCPYVVHRFRETESKWGDWAYKGTEARVHRINWRISRQDRSIDRHQFPKWFGAGAGDKPETVPMGDTSMSWVKLHPDSPPPILQAIVAQLDQKAAQEFWMDLRDEIRGAQPELNFNDVKLLANISGETIEHAKQPTAQAIEAAKPGFDHALIRAMQMAVSAGIVVSAWDVGTGTGSADAADKAYQQGLEDFTLAARPSLPTTPLQQVSQAQASQAEQQQKFATANAARNVVGDPVELLKLAGYSDKDAQRIAANAPDNTQNGNGTNARAARIIGNLS